MKWIVLITAVVLNALANILIKTAMLGSNKEQNIINILRAKWLSLPMLGGILSFALALIAYSYILSKMNLSIAYPIMTSTGFIIVILASYVFFHEQITTLQIIGFILMLLGVWMVAK